MNKNDITKKLQKFLQNHPKLKEECEVVYLMVEIRKILDQDKKTHYKTIRFYCNWALHFELTQEGSIQFLSKEFEKDIDLKKRRRQISKKIALNHKNFFKLYDLRSQLDKFFKKYNLPPDLLKGNAWYKFTELLLEVIKECPVKRNSSKIHSLELEKTKDGYYFRFSLADNKRIPRIKLTLKKNKVIKQKRP